MNLLQKITAAGLAGCLLLTAAIPETAAIAVFAEESAGSTEASAPAAYDTIDLKFGTPTLITKEIGGVEHSIKFSGVFAVSGPSVLDIQNTDDASVIAELKGYVLEAVQYAVMETDFTAENYNAYQHEIRRRAAEYFAEKGYDKKTGFNLISISIGSMTFTPVETVAAPVTAPEYPYTITVPSSKTVKPGEEVDVRFGITNEGALPLASFYCDWFCNMGLCPENVTVKLTPEAENKETANESLIDIHFTVGSNAQAGVYPFGINVTDLRDTEDNIVISSLYKGSESMTIVVKPEDAEPAAPTQIYNVLFPKAAVKQGESKEIRLSIQHDTTAKYLRSIKAGSYTADGLTFTWEAMTLDDKENSTLSIPMTVTAAADATTGVHKYFVPLENVLVNEDGETVPLSSLAFSRLGSLNVDQGFSANNAEKPSIELKLPEIPAIAPGEKYAFEAEMILSAAGDFKAVKSGAGEKDGCFRFEWQTVLFDQEGQTSYKIPFTIEFSDTAKGTYEAKLPEHMYAFIYDANGDYISPDIIKADTLKVTVKDGTESGLLGDVNLDGVVNAKDANLVLIAAAKLGTGSASGLTERQNKLADVNADGEINAKDANVILRYSAAVGAGLSVDILEFV